MYLLLVNCLFRSVAVCDILLGDPSFVAWEEWASEMAKNSMTYFMDSPIFLPYAIKKVC